MSSPPIHGIVVDIGDERRDALLSALRRGDSAAALELLDGWCSHFGEREVDWDDWNEECDFDAHQNDLTTWTREECRLHVAGGRFQHALALLDRYLVLPPALTRAETDKRISDR